MKEYTNTLNQINAIRNAMNLLNNNRLENALLNLSCEYDYLSIADYTIDNYLQGALAYIDNKTACDWALSKLYDEIESKKIAVESENE